MSNIWKAAAWAILIIAVALAGRSEVLLNHDTSAVLVTTLPILALASLKGRSSCNWRARA
ncbi:MAG: hypothetical protein APF78_09940 [Sphingomonadales bacterium BRH_c3]|nr:MAG: hypothetical protein APF78_09940 [Sphingomonadales bacterium BRH_c3]